MQVDFVGRSESYGGFFIDEKKIQLNNLPSTLRKTALFCCWKFERREGSDKPTKMPYNPRTGGGAQSNNPATFAPLKVAEAACGDYDGLGVGIFGDVCAIDIDHCVDEHGCPSHMAADILSTMNCYTEYSPSGTGMRFLFQAPGFLYDKARYYINNQKAGLEIYISGNTSKFVTVTGNVIHNGEYTDRSRALQQILDRYMLRSSGVPTQTPNPPSKLPSMEDSTLIERAKSARNGSVFSALWSGNTTGYSSRSEADIALCHILAFWTGRDAHQIDRLFRASGLMREKWDRRQSGSSYGAITIQNAIRNCSEVYNSQEHLEKRANENVAPIKGKTLTLADLHPEKNKRYGWHDIGNGYLFADWYKDKARYVPERKRWFVYHGKVWKADSADLKVMELCKKLANSLMIYALSLRDEHLKQDYMKYVSKWQRRNYRETVIRDAASVYPVEFAKFDADPFLYNCLNGTLDLQTGEFHSHTPTDMLSKISGVKYDPKAKCERWERFINEVMQGDQDKAVFLQKALGYALTGDTKHECFFVLYGPTSRNGKGTTMETFMRLMGDYGKTGKPDTIAQKQTANGSGPNEDIARLVGARFVNIAEPDKKLTLSAALVKTLTGNDTVPARFLNENSFEYKPDFKLFINTNYLPAVTDITLFNSGRVKIIPFEKHFDEVERDTGLKEELGRPENLSGILNWCYHGLKLIEQTGFEMPEAVCLATNEYRNNSDKLGRFIDEEMEVQPMAETGTADIYNRYKLWCSSCGFFPENVANFKSSLSNIATVVKRRPSGSGRTASPISLLFGYRLKEQQNFGE